MAIFPLVTVRLPIIAAPASMAPGSHEVMMADGASTKVGTLDPLLHQSLGGRKILDTFGEWYN